MPNVKKILFPMDLVELTREIVPWADLMARRFGAGLHVLHVIPDPGYWGVAYGIDPSHLDDEPALIRKAEKSAGDLCEEYFGKDLNVSIKAVVGDPAEEILRYIEDESISMVVMGTHARRGLERVFFGSVANRVVKSSPVPVLTVNPHAKSA
ncbi:MAG: universal stress protein [Deltaproteobacteria bacterium]|nr:universal stress protein [Deltaproteobacteria bacterium]